MDDLKKKGMVALKIGAVSAGAIYTAFDSETVMAMLGSAFQEKVVQAGAAFTIAAWLHSGRVKKEINTMSVGIISSVDNVAKALRQDLEVQSKRMDHIEDGISKLTSRVDSLEKKGD